MKGKVHVKYKISKQLLNELHKTKGGQKHEKKNCITSCKRYGS